MRAITIKILSNAYGIARLPPESKIPGWADGDGFVSISRSNDELSIVCYESRIPEAETTSRGWVCTKLVGPFAFDETGIVASITTPLASASIGVFIVSTYDGDHILVKQQVLEQAISAWENAGHRVVR